MKSNKVCRKCGVPLVIGENVTQYRIDSHQYICRKCKRHDAKKREDAHPTNSAYRCEYNHRTGRSQPMSKNKECPSYLGIHIAERVLSHIFENVRRMPNNNPGFDVICNQDKLIDIKSACRQHIPPWADSWTFIINKNQIAQYFLCLAFDNRQDLNPEHIWLIPACNVNDKIGVSIAETRLAKWSKYEQPVDKVIDCCNTLR